MPHRHGYKPLSVQALALAPSLPKVQRSAQPHDPALSLFTDLHHSPCVIASHRDGLDQTLHLMRRAGVRMVFVAGLDGELVGMVTAEVLQGERPVLRASAHHVPHRELTVADIMVPVTQWDTVDIAHVRVAHVGDIVATLREHNLRYLLVTQKKDGATVLRGLFSVSRLEQALNTTIEPDLHSRNFAELEMVLAH
jgi:CBS domain containing-hemolysin-like protein